MTTKKVWAEYWNVLKAGKNEYDVLLNATEEQLLTVTSPEIAKAILAVRNGDIKIKPGYDGVYGVLEIPGVALHAPPDDEAGKTEGGGAPKRRGRPPTQSAAEPQKGLSEFL